MVVIKFKDLINNKLLKNEIKNAFSNTGTGYVLIKGIPKFNELRNKVLKSGYFLAHQPKTVLDSISKPDIDYSIGWDVSTFITEHDQRHSMFNSFTARCLKESLVYPKNKEMEKAHKNVWPDIPNFKEDFVEFGKLIANCQLEVLKHIDMYLNESISCNVYNSLKNDHDAYNRLIIYNPIEKFNTSNDTWDGWHTDYSALTALVHPMYFEKTGEIFPCKNTCINIINRKGEKSVAEFDEEDLYIQASDTIFILTGGEIPPTPHAVKIQKDMPKNKFRIQFATFFQPNYNYVMNIPNNMSYDDIIKKDPLGLPYKTCNFKNGWDFGDFYENSLNYLLDRPKI